jgi:hypothetical protein
MGPDVPEGGNGSPMGWQGYEPAWPVPGRPGGPVPAGAAPSPERGQRLAGSGGRNPRSRPKTGRLRRAVLRTGMVLGVVGLAASALGIAWQLMPRHFTPAQRARISAWEAEKRWRTWPAGQIFPRTIGYQLPGTAFGGGAGLPLTAKRVGIARQARCRAATVRAAAAVLARHGCLAVLRATYNDQTQTIAVTVAVAVMPGAGAVTASARSLPHGPTAAVRAVSFPHTPVAAFHGPRGQISWQVAAGPYLVLASAGYADGRPWLASSSDSYTRAEMLSLAAGVGHWVASHLGAPSPPPRCPGIPAC